MSSSLRSSQATVFCPNGTIASSQRVVNGRHNVSFPPVGRIHARRCIAKHSERRGSMSATRSRFLGSVRVGQGLGCVGNGSKWSAGTWLDNKASVDAEISVADAWELWNDREGIPRWMQWIDTVTVSKQKPEFSKWTLRYRAFDRDFEFSWLARSMKPKHHQKIHWRSVDGVPNRGAVRFFPRGPNACTIELTISYELPDIVAPLGTAAGPIVESVLKSDLNRFAKLSKSKQLARL